MHCIISKTGLHLSCTCWTVQFNSTHTWILQREIIFTIELHTTGQGRDIQSQFSTMCIYGYLPVLTTQHPRCSEEDVSSQYQVEFSTWPVAALKIIFSLNGRILRLLYNMLLLLQFLMKTLSTTTKLIQFNTTLENINTKFDCLTVINCENVHIEHRVTFIIQKEVSTVT